MRRSFSGYQADQFEHGVFEGWLVDVEIRRHGSAASAAGVDEVGADVGQHPAVAAQLDTVAGEADGTHAADRAEVGCLGVRIGEGDSDARPVLLDQLGR